MMWLLLIWVCVVLGAVCLLVIISYTVAWLGVRREIAPIRQRLPADYERVDVNIRHMLIEGFSCHWIAEALRVSIWRVQLIQEELMRERRN